MRAGLVSLPQDGNAVSWHNWRFRVGFTPREGLTLHNLALYDVDQGRIRPVRVAAILTQRRLQVIV